MTRLNELSVAFDYNGEVTAADAQDVLDKIVSLHTRATDAIPHASTQERADALRLFAANLNEAFYGFSLPSTMCSTRRRTWRRSSLRARVAVACMWASTYGFLQGAWPFGIVEAIWAIVALRRWRLRRSH